MAASLPSVIRTSDLVPARDRTIPVESALTPLFPDAGLRRGHVMSFEGIAARSLAIATAARGVADGAWLAVIGVDGFGIEAAIEHGIAPERVVQIPASGPIDWAERLAVAVDGFELILTCPPRGADRQMRKLRQRLQARGGVLLAVPPVPMGSGTAHGTVAIGADIELATREVAWVGIEQGNGRLLARRVTITSSGRRVPRPITIDCWLPGPDGRVDVVQTGAGNTRRDETDVSADTSVETLHRAS